MSTPEPCWYADREPWEEMHFATEAEARADALSQAMEDDNPPEPVRRHAVPCTEFVCIDCGGTYHALGEAPAAGLCGECW